MEAATKSIYDTLLIESNDQKQRIDLRTSVVAFEYYEDIFSPVITAKLKIVNSGNSASTEKDTSKQSLYNGLPLRGGERLAFKMKPNTRTNISLDFASRVEDYFYVSSITDVIAETDGPQYYQVWKALEPDGEKTYHLELNNVTLHFFKEEWEELLTLAESLVK